MADPEPAEPAAPMAPPSAEPDARAAIPATLPVLPLGPNVVFPGGIGPIAIGEERSERLIEDVMDRSERMIAVVGSRAADGAEPGPGELYAVGTAATVLRMMRVPDGSMRVLVQGNERVAISGYPQTEPYLVADVAVLPDTGEVTTEVRALAQNLTALFIRVVTLVPYLPDELQAAVAGVDDPAALSHLVAGSLRFSNEERQALLEEVDLEARLRRLTVLTNRELEVLELGAKIQSDVQSGMDQAQREHFLRQQMRAIQQELGEGDDIQAAVNDLRERLAAADPPEEVRVAAERELRRLERVPAESAEHSVIRTYLEWITDLPWSTLTEDNLDLRHAQEVLDEDHYGLERIKDRLIEQLAVIRLNPSAPGPILCFVGPPGVGKTSLGRSIARATGRRFARISVGGVRDESEIRGHRRTYVGALPGSIVRALRDAGSMNPVMMIDEIDKMGADVRGDPAAAMLEVLDPAQNDTFRDHYLDLPVDLSRVLFVCTANVLDTVPGALRDRMEVISLPGYTDHEKLEIARRYLLPRRRRESGLSEEQLRVGDDALRTIISEYTREAGVRQLERQIGAVARKLARQVAEGEDRPEPVDADRARALLGPERIHNEVKRRTEEPGVVTGLAVTGAGGEILFVEAQVMPGAGKLTITGQLGDVMRESAQAALTYVRSHAGPLGLELAADFFATHDIHLHVPAGAVPKDGPSAGVTMVTALVSALSGRPASADVAMTGEITLTGQVLPIGGVKEKVLAAQRAGIGTVVVPRLNEEQLVDVPAELRAQMTIIAADRLEQVVAAALLDGTGGGG